MKKNQIKTLVPTGKNPQFPIPVAEHEAAAKFFALSNTAMIENVAHISKTDLDVMYQAAHQMYLEEVGQGLSEEYYDWLSEIRKAKPSDYVVERWNEVKANYTFKKS